MNIDIQADGKDLILKYSPQDSGWLREILFEQEGEYDIR